MTRRSWWLVGFGGFWLGLVVGAAVGVAVAVDAKATVSAQAEELEEMRAAMLTSEDELRVCARRGRLAEVLGEIARENFGRARDLRDALVEDVVSDDPELAAVLEELVIEPSDHLAASEKLSELVLVVPSDG